MVNILEDAIVLDLRHSNRKAVTEFALQARHRHPWALVVMLGGTSHKPGERINGDIIRTVWLCPRDLPCGEKQRFPLPLRADPDLECGDLLVTICDKLWSNAGKQNCPQKVSLHVLCELMTDVWCRNEAFRERVNREAGRAISKDGYDCV